MEVTHARPVDRVEPWSWPKDYFQISGMDEPINDEGSENDQEASSDEDYGSRLSEEEEEGEEEEREEDDDDDSEISVDYIDEDEDISDPEMPDPQFLIVEQPPPPPPQPPAYISPASIAVVEEKVTTTTTPVELVTQIQSPPITPEQPLISSTRKRPLSADEDEFSTTSLPLPQNIATIRWGSLDLLTQLSAVQAKIDTSSNQTLTGPVEENASPNHQCEEPERAIKRRRTDETTGWSDVMKTMGKYTVAGVIGGIATFVGLAWGGGN